MPNSNYALWGGRVFIVAALMIGFASIFGFDRYASFHQRVEDLKASGELLAIEDLCHKVERPEDDAKFYLRKIYESAKEVDRVISVKEDQDESAAGSRTDPEAMAMFARLTDEHPDLFPTITLAAAAPKMSYDLEIEPTLDEDSEPMKNMRSYDSNNEWVIVQKVLRVLDWKCEVQIAQGDFDGAFDSAIELMRLGKLKSQHGPLLHIFLGIAFQRQASFRLAQLSERQSLSAKKLRVVYSLIEDNDLMGGYRRCLRSERSVLTYHIINFGGDGKTWSDNEPVVWLFSQFKSGPAMAVGNQFLDSFQSAIEWSELPLSEELAADPNKSSTLLGRFGGLAPDTYNRFRLEVGEAIAESRVLQIVLALDANPDSADRDDWPVEYLTNIGVPESATIDPFDDQPMRIKRTNGKWNVYSIGQDRKDDGGVKFSDSGVAPMYRN